MHVYYSYVADDGIGAEEARGNYKKYTWRDVLSAWKVVSTKSARKWILWKTKKQFWYYMAMSCVQGRGNAGPEQANKLKDGLARVPLPWHLLISGRFAAVAPENLLWEEEVAVVAPWFMVDLSAGVTYFWVNCRSVTELGIPCKKLVCHTREICFTML